jgi:transposase InsO family protein
MADPVDKLAKIYVNEVVRLHGVPTSIVSDRDPRFTSRLWPSIQRALGTNLSISTAFHPHTNGRSERVIQILEDLLRAYALEFRGNWEEHLSLVEFTNNNSYETTIRMAPLKLFIAESVGHPCVGKKLGTKSCMGQN